MKFLEVHHKVCASFLTFHFFSLPFAPTTTDLSWPLATALYKSKQEEVPPHAVTTTRNKNLIMAGNSNYPPAYAVLGEQIGSLIAAKDQRIQRLEKEVKARDDRFAQALEVHNQRVSTFNDTLNQRAQQVQMS